MSTNKSEDPVTTQLIALAAEGERLHRRLDAADAAVNDLTARWEKFADRTGNPPAPAVASWLQLPDNTTAERATELLVDLVDWLDHIYLRFPDGRAGLPPCWLQHPHVVEELLWLRRGWAAAHHPKSGSASQVADWHDRMRPGVARRIRGAAGTCAPETHSPEAPRNEPDPPGRAQIAFAARQWIAQTGSRRGAPS